MSTFAEREHDKHTKLLTLAAANCDRARSDLEADVAAKQFSLHSQVLDLLEKYSAFDFQPGSDWHAVEANWLAAPHTYARTHALAVLMEIRHCLD